MKAVRRKLAVAMLFSACWPAIAAQRGPGGVAIEGPPERVTARRWAILIGVNRYEDEPGIGSLTRAVWDVNYLMAVLTTPYGGFGAKDILPLFDTAPDKLRRPTYANIATLCPRWFEAARDNDAAMVVFSGHCAVQAGQCYLLPSSAKRAALKLTAIRLAEAIGWLKNSRAQHKILVLDVSHAGNAGAALPAELKRELEAEPGVISLTACDVGQRSYDHEKFAQGLFLFHFARGLSGKADANSDGVVSLLETYAYAARKVQAWAHDHWLRQDPLLIHGDRADVPLSFVPDPSMTIVIEPKKRRGKGNKRAAKRGPEYSPGKSISQSIRERMLERARRFHEEQMREEMGSPVTPANTRSAYRQLKRRGGRPGPGRVPSRLAAHFMAPDSDRDQYGNPVTTGQRGPLDAETGHPFEIWLKNPRMEFVFIPAGVFVMGSAEHGVAAKPHRVVLASAFYMAKYEATVAQYRAVCGEPPPGKASRGPRCPALLSSWGQAARFCSRLAATLGADVRLPTEAEWERACRAGSATLYHFGDDRDHVREDDFCWRRSNSGGAVHPVGLKLPNAWGLYDMYGNAWEWCADWYSPMYYSLAGVRGHTDPKGPARGFERIMRGGSCLEEHALPSGYRGKARPQDARAPVGLRCVVLP